MPDGARPSRDVLRNALVASVRRAFIRTDEHRIYSAKDGRDCHGCWGRYIVPATEENRTVLRAKPTRLVDDALLRLGLVDVGSLPWSWDEADLLRRFKLWADNEYLALASWGLYRRESASIHRARIGGDDENLSC